MNSVVDFYSIDTTVMNSCNKDKPTNDASPVKFVPHGNDYLYSMVKYTCFFKSTHLWFNQLKQRFSNCCDRVRKRVLNEPLRVGGSRTLYLLSVARNAPIRRIRCFSDTSIRFRFGDWYGNVFVFFFFPLEVSTQKRKCRISKKKKKGSERLEIFTRLHDRTAKSVLTIFEWFTEFQNFEFPEIFSIFTVAVPQNLGLSV